MIGKEPPEYPGQGRGAELSRTTHQGAGSRQVFLVSPVHVTPPSAGSDSRLWHTGKDGTQLSARLRCAKGI